MSQQAVTVEYCIGGRWGTVCNYNWGDADVAVVCR